MSKKDISYSIQARGSTLSKLKTQRLNKSFNRISFKRSHMKKSGKHSSHLSPYKLGNTFKNVKAKFTKPKVILEAEITSKDYNLDLIDPHSSEE